MVASAAQRMDSIEERVEQRFTNLDARLDGLAQSIGQMVTQGIEEAQKRLAEEARVRQEEEALKSMEAITAATEKLEGRISRFRQTQESQMAALKTSQEKWQKEIQATLAGKKPTFLPQTEPVFMDLENREEGLETVATGFRGGSGFERGGGFAGGGSNWRFRKVDMPAFDGTDPDGWVMRAEHYFQVHRLSEKEKLDSVLVAMEGDAL